MSDPADASAWVLKAEHDLTAVVLIGSTSDVPWDIVKGAQIARRIRAAVLDRLPPEAP